MFFININVDKNIKYFVKNIFGIMYYYFIKKFK